MPGPADQLYVLYLPDSDKFVALRYNADAEYIASLLEIPLHAIKVTPPQLSVGFLSRWTMRDAQRGTQYGVIDLESECGIFLLTIAREPDGERMEPDVVITLLEAETDSYFQGVFESERKGTLRLFGDWFESDTSNPVTRWRWNYEKWTHWLNRFRDDLAEEICLETDGMLLRFHITRMFQSHT